MTQLAKNPAEGAGSGINKVAKDKAGLNQRGFNADLGSDPMTAAGMSILVCIYLPQMLLVWNIYLHLVKNGYIQGEM